MMGWIAIFIGPVTAFAFWSLREFGFPNSISETGTLIDRTVALLPFALGALSLFSLSYAVTYSYDKLDRLFSLIMCIGFTIVAFQPCASAYLVSDRVGVFSLPQKVSGWVHNIGALVGFASMILWVLRFRKSDKSKPEQTKEKQLRNKWYFGFSLLMSIALVFFIFNIAGAFKEGFAIVFWLEFFVLVPCGLSCLIKGGLLFMDEVEKTEKRDAK